MKIKHFALTVVLLSFAGSNVLADRSLDRAEILQIFQKLTSQPRKTWICAGTIKAERLEYRAPKTTDVDEINSRIKEKVREYQGNPNKHELTEDLQKMKLDAIPFSVRYKLSNEYTMESTVIVKLDGERSYYEINVDSRTDSVKPGRDLEGNFMTGEFNLDWNARRISVWNGQTCANYVLPVNHAIVDSTGSTPRRVSGPLTAGLVPWGHGYYEYQNLCNLESSAVEEDIDGQKQVRLTLHISDGLEMLFVLDAEKDYATISRTLTRPGNSITITRNSDYQSVAGNWVPTTILIERYDADTNRLLASDLWNFTMISSDVPTGDSFSVRYEPDALIEYFSYLTDRPLMYRYSDVIDTDLLLAERLTVAASGGTQAQNCATIAVKYAASQLGKNVTDQQLAGLIEEPGNTTSLYAMKEFLQGLGGLYCRAVNTDIQTLQSLYGCQAILHIPGRKHFTVLGYVDNDSVWSIDLASNKFVYRTDINFFGMDWTEGTALLISNEPIQMEGNLIEIVDSQLREIIGGSGWTCTRRLQYYHIIFCDKPVLGACEGTYRIYPDRWGCETAESGSCAYYWMVRMREYPCVEHPDDPYMCTAVLPATLHYMWACE